MAVLMAKSERIQKAYSDYKHLSTDNLSFVAGLRGRPVPVPVSDSKRGKTRKPANARKHEDGEVPDEDELDSGGDVPSATQVPCSNKNCAPRTEQLEAMTEQRVGAQKSRQKAQSRLAILREASQEAESKLEENKAEVLRMSTYIIEGEERTDALRDTLRDEGSLNKACAEELAVVLKEAMDLRRAFAAETQPPRPRTATAVSSGESTVTSDGRVLRPPVLASGFIQSNNNGCFKGRSSGSAGEHSYSNIGLRDWAHSGRHSYTHVFTRAPKVSAVPSDDTDGSNVDGLLRRGDGVFTSGMPTESRTVQDLEPMVVGEDRGSSSSGLATAAREHGGGRSPDGEDAWSCCGKTVSNGGRGCEPKEPVATPEDLLLDAIDPRSRIGHPLDFRKFFPSIAWMGINPDPLSFFAGSANEGTLRPHTAPERLGAGAQEEYHRKAGLSRVGGCGGRGVESSGVQQIQGRPNSSFGAWWQRQDPTRGSTIKPKRHDFLRRSDRGSPYTFTTRGRQSGKGSGLVGKAGSALAQERQERLPNMRVGEAGTLKKKSTHSPYSGPGEKASTLKKLHVRNSAVLVKDRRQRGLFDSVDSTDKATSIPGADASKGTGPGEDADFQSRTQIFGMNGGRLPREVRQAPIGRPLTAPSGKVGRRRVRTRVTRGPARR